MRVPGTRANATYCWGPGPKNCQKMNKVTCAEQCDGDRCFGPDSNQCCHAQCSAGCDGPSKTDCWVGDRVGKHAYESLDKNSREE